MRGRQARQRIARRDARVLCVAVGVSIAMTVGFCGCRSGLRPIDRTRWAKAWLAALNSHRLEDFDGLLMPGGTYEDPLTNGQRSGPGLAFVFVFAWKAFPQSRYELQRVSGEGDVVVVNWTATGLGAVTAEKPLEGVFVIHVHGNAIASVQGSFDASRFGPQHRPDRTRLPGPDEATIPAAPRQ